MGEKNIAIWVDRPYQSDEIFNPDSSLNRDDCLAPFRLLKKKIEDIGGRCHTQDVFREFQTCPDIVIFLDIPVIALDEILGSWKKHVRKWLIIQECEVIKPRNWYSPLHWQFEKIFTWNDQIIDNVKYIKLNFANVFPEVIVKNSRKEKLCTLMAGHKKANHELELYSERIRAIRWFENHHPSEFDLYGVGWDEFRFGGSKPVRVLNRIKLLTKILTPLAPRFPSYKGRVVAKKDILAKYYFAICYENARDIPGYITEKIFDCFFAGCVPIYWGANNIDAHIPSSCFIDKRDFDSYEELYQFITSLNERAYLDYLDNIERYLKSEQSFPFTVECYAETIMKEIIREC